MKNGKFEIGDLVKVKDYAVLPSGYSITNKGMIVGEVTSLENLSWNEEIDIIVKVLDHEVKDYIGRTFLVMSKYFELITPEKKNKEKKVIKKKEQQKQNNNGLPFSINILEEQGKTFIIIDKKHTICIEGSFGISSVNSDSTDVFNEEIGKALAVYRMNNKKENK